MACMWALVCTGGATKRPDHVPIVIEGHAEVLRSTGTADDFLARRCVFAPDVCMAYQRSDNLLWLQHEHDIDVVL